jgi:O-acetyl-ADP-ribose deacetylase (regulator of RNase III)
MATRGRGPRGREPQPAAEGAEFPIGGRRIVLERGDITLQAADAIVTAANAGLLGGGGVDGAVHRAAGPRLLQACREIGGCETGSAVRTPAFDLERRGVRYVIHAVGPRFRDGEHGEPDLLRAAYRASLEIADRSGCASIAFPSISTGVYGFPVERAAPIAVRTAAEFLRTGARVVVRVVFVLFDAGTHAEFGRAARSL